MLVSAYINIYIMVYLNTKSKRLNHIRNNKYYFRSGNVLVYRLLERTIIMAFLLYKLLNQLDKFVLVYLKIFTCVIYNISNNSNTKFCIVFGTRVLPYIKATKSKKYTLLQKSSA